MKTVKLIATATLALLTLPSIIAIAQTEQLKPAYDVKLAKKPRADEQSRAANPVACDAGQTCDSPLIFSWGDNNVQQLHIENADFKPAKGDAFSVCSSSSCAGSSSAKVNVQDISFKKYQDFRFMSSTAVSSDQGVVTLHFSSASPEDSITHGGVTAMDDWSPQQRCAAGKHFPKIVLTRNNSSVTLTDVMVSSCDAGSVTLGYERMAINTKGTAGTKGSTK